FVEDRRHLGKTIKQACCFCSRFALSLQKSYRIMKRPEVLNDIKNAIADEVPGASAIVYGSEARGDAHRDSDIDLLILLAENDLTPEREQEIITLLYGIEVRTGVIISPIIMPRAKWNSRRSETPFSLNVTNEGVLL
ncbi:MAG: nucleotidyltransferase domain-containing protein, partial [Muribaculaceae bacterium]